MCCSDTTSNSGELCSSFDTSGVLLRTRRQMNGCNTVQSSVSIEHSSTGYAGYLLHTWWPLAQHIIEPGLLGPTWHVAMLLDLYVAALAAMHGPVHKDCAYTFTYTYLTVVSNRITCGTGRTRLRCPLCSWLMPCRQWTPTTALST